MSNGVGTATRMLLVNSVISVFVLVAQITSLVIYGPTHDYWLLYIALSMIMFSTSLVAQWVIRRSLFAGVNFYAWICYGCVAGMVCIDQSNGSVGFPLILFVLTLGVLGLGLTVGYVGSVPYSAVCCITVLAVGVNSRNLDASIAAATLLAGTAAMASEGAHTSKRLDDTTERLSSLENAIEAYVGTKRELRQNTAADRGS